MKSYVHHIIYATLTVLLCTGVGLIVHDVRTKRKLVTVNRLQVEFADSLKFVSESDIKGFLSANYGPYIGQRLDSIKLHDIESMLKSRSAVLESQAWTTEDGTLHISITQRAPQMRFANGSSGYYIASDGYIFPLHKSYTADVPTIYGNVPMMPSANYKGPAPTIEQREWFSDMLEFKRTAYSRQGPSKKIDSLWVDSKGDLRLTVQGENEMFIFGNPEQLEEKFAKIDKYFAYIKPFKQEGYYKIVNLKYKEQIICRQKDI
ncbi:MAG TPA: hypothetical protein DHU72_04615 [Rikenellaceae bacterium]|nr:hypothetical protein [Rikenellaceae bacterium]HBH20745.1 hypothetical protein [Rikenellaceae bacterium]HCZ22712.1 hypothetical protein [Rikenellaceae bacterium]